MYYCPKCEKLTPHSKLDSRIKHVGTGQFLSCVMDCDICGYVADITLNLEGAEHSLVYEEDLYNTMKEIREYVNSCVLGAYNMPQMLTHKDWYEIGN
jgi:hypothetical protein